MTCFSDVVLKKFRLITENNYERVINTSFVLVNVYKIIESNLRNEAWRGGITLNNSLNFHCE